MTLRISNLRTALTAFAVVVFVGTLTLTGLAQPAGGGQGRGGVGLLDDQQQQVFREAMQKNSDQLRVLGDKLRVAQKELIEATLAEKYDESAVRGKAEAVAKIQVEMITLRAKALSTVAPTLKPEQKENLLNSRVSTFLLTTGFDTMGGDRGGPRGDRGGPPDASGGRDRGGRQGDQGGRDRPRQ